MAGQVGQRVLAVAAAVEWAGSLGDHMTTVGIVDSAETGNCRLLVETEVVVAAVAAVVVVVVDCSQQEGHMFDKDRERRILEVYSD